MFVSSLKVHAARLTYTPLYVGGKTSNNNIIPFKSVTGWSKKTTPNGQVYYANKNTKATQWNRPSAPHQPQETREIQHLLVQPSPGKLTLKLANR